MKVDPEKYIPTKSSSAAEWIEWHKSLKSSFGKANANALFLKAWNLRGGKSSDANTDDLRSYLRTNGIEIDKTLFASVVDTTESAIDTIGGVFNMGKTAVIIVGVALLVPMVILLVNVAKNPNAVASAAGQGLGKGIKPV